MSGFSAPLLVGPWLLYVAVWSSPFSLGVIAATVITPPPASDCASRLLSPVETRSVSIDARSAPPSTNSSSSSGLAAPRQFCTTTPKRAFTPSFLKVSSSRGSCVSIACRRVLDATTEEA